MKRSKKIGLAALCSVCILMGNKTAGDPPPDFIKIAGPVRTVHDTAPAPPAVVIKTPLNEHCKAALKLSGKMASYADKLYANGDKQLMIISDIRRRLADTGNTTPVEDQQRILLGHEIGALADSQQTLVLFHTEMNLCKGSL
jgi:hypothetical protein